MTLLAILRNTGATLLRAPLLWLFSAVVVVTNDFVSLGGNTTVWLACHCCSSLSLFLPRRARYEPFSYTMRAVTHRSRRSSGMAPVG